MAQYLIERREQLYGTWSIEAISKEEAEKKWETMKRNGEIDYSSMELYDSTETIREA